MNRRRRFLLLGLGGAVVAGLGLVGIGVLVSKSEIVSKVRGRLSFLKLDEAGLHQFAQDQVGTLLAKRPTWNRMKYHFLHIFSKSFSPYDRSNDTRSRNEKIIDGFAATYLLSSDFFLNGADVSRVVKYIRFYDPLTPCGNPFARPVIDTRVPA